MDKLPEVNMSAVWMNASTGLAIDLSIFINSDMAS